MLKINLYNKEEIKSVSELYHFVLNEEFESFSDKEYHHGLFLKREDAGDFEIAEGVILPHFQSEEINETKIYVVKLNNIKNPTTGKENIVVAVVLMLKRDDDVVIEDVKKFMHMLANDSFIEHLKLVESQKDLNALITRRR